MTKTYQKPAMEIVNVELHQLCQDSIAIGTPFEEGNDGNILSNDNFGLWND